MVDGGRDVDEAQFMGTPPAVVYIVSVDTPVFVLREDPVLLKLRDGETPDAVRWPDLAGIEAHAVVDGMVPSVARRLVAVLLEVGAEAVIELDIADDQPYAVATHEGRGR